MSPDRRQVLTASFALAAELTAGPGRTATGAGLDDHTKLWLKLVSDLSGRAVYSVEQGAVWGFKPQADDLTTDAFAKRLYGYWSLVARRVAVLPDGVALTTKAWTFYLDPQSDAVVTEINNPYTGKMVPCPPLSGPAFTAHYGGTAQTQPMDLRQRRIGDQAWVEISRTSRFKPADTTWFKLETDLISYACQGVDLDRTGTSHIPSRWSHNVVAEWQTWMSMHGTPGHILFKGDGALIPALAKAPAALLAAVELHFPNTLTAVAAWN